MGSKFRFQPIFVNDLAKAIVNVIEIKENDGKIIEIGGKKVISFGDMVKLILKIIKGVNMVFDHDMIQKYYEKLPEKINATRILLNRPIILTEKILYSHLFESLLQNYERGIDYVDFQPDRVAMQDATAQMALLQLVLIKVVLIHMEG